MSRIYYVYILLCSDKTYYTGVTNDLDRRLKEHEAGVHKESYTVKRRPIILQWYSEFSNVEYAIEIEKKIKKWSAKKKRALIDENWDQLRLLAECRNVSNSKFYKLRQSEDGD